MSEREEGYQQALADAERVCLMVAASWIDKGNAMPEGRQAVPKLIADTLALVGRSISELQPGYVSPRSGP